MVDRALIVTVVLLPLGVRRQVEEAHPNAMTGFKPVEFDGEKFMTDLYQDKAKPKSGAKGDQPGKWKEKNSKEAAPPPKEGAKGGAPQGKDTAPPPAKSKVKPGGPKKAKKPADPNARTADGKTVKEHQDAASRRAQQGKGKRPKNSHDKDLEDGLRALNAVTQRYSEDGASLDELKTAIKAVRRKHKVFRSIEVVDCGPRWGLRYQAEPGEIKGPKKAVGQKDRVDESLASDDTRVWVNTNTGVVHLPGSKHFGATNKGAYMTLKQARAAG